MATQNHTISGDNANPYIASLLWGNSGWNLDSPITYFLADSLTGGDAITTTSAASNGYDGVVDGWSAAETASFVKILNNYAAVCGLTFAQASSVQTANLVEWQVSDSFWDDQGTFGQHDIPDSDNGHNNNANQIWGYYNFQATSSWPQSQQGGDGFQTMIHELGHGLGLAHPHDGGGDGDLFPGVGSSGDTGDYGMNQCPYTVMSYNVFFDQAPTPPNSSYGETGTLGAFDIAALQVIYGANMSTATGADTYVMPTANKVGTFWSCIWDAGGTDTLDNTASTVSSTMDLRDAPLTGPHAGGFISENLNITGGFTIANGVVIENALGGSGADSMIGNLVANTLKGNNGNDTIVGNAGSDSVLGGAGNDALYGDAMKGLPSGVGFGSGTVTKAAGAGNFDLAHAIDVTNAFSLASNANIVDSTTTPHVTVSGTGDSHVDFYKLTLNAGVTLTLDIDNTSSGIDSFIKLLDSSGMVLAYDDDSGTNAGAGGSSTNRDSFLSYTVMTAGTYYVGVGDFASSTDYEAITNFATYQLQISAAGDPDTGSGNGADTLYGEAGNDTIDGGLGADSMIGGANNDTYYVDNAGDRVIEALNDGTDTVHTTLGSYTLAANVERLYFDDNNAHTGKGNILDNLIYGNGGLDKFLIDAGGHDTFSGGGGEDTFDGRASATGMTLRLDNQVNNAGSVAGDTFASIEKFFGSDTAGDAMTTGAARAKFFGYGGNDTLTGGSSIDALSGGAGNDKLVGNAGRDALDGGIGNDTMTGGADADTFTFVDHAFGKDVITDFEDGIDKLKVFSAVADRFSDFTVTGNGTHHVVLTLADATANTITLDNAAHNITVSAADFLFY